MLTKTNLTRVLFVDAGGAPSTEVGSIANPYLTIQAAVSAVGYPTKVADSAKDWIVLIAPGDYNESVTIKGPVRLALIGLGAFRLGRYTVDGEAQSNIVPAHVDPALPDGGATRNLVWTYDHDQLIHGGAAPQLVIGTIAGTDVVRPGKPIANRISGAIIVQGGGWIAKDGTSNGPKGGTAFLAIANTQVDAGITQGLTPLNDPCGRQRAAVNAKNDEINSLQDRLRQTKFELTLAATDDKDDIIVRIGEIGGDITQAESELLSLQTALDVCISRYSGAVGFDPDAAVVANPDFAPIAINALRFNGILVDRHFNSRFRGQIVGHLNGEPKKAPAYVLATSFMSQYEQLVQVSQYASIEQAGFERGMTVSQVPSLGTLRSVVPPGMVNSTFAGPFTGPAGSLLLDATTNTWFIRNKATLAGGATKSFLGGASQTLAIQAAKTLLDSDCGVTLLADATNVTGTSLSVKLPSAVGKDDLTFTIKNVGTAKDVIVEPKLGETIDGLSNLALVLPPGVPSAIKIVAHGGKWWIVAQVGGAPRTLAIQAAKTLLDTDGGVTLLADATNAPGASFSVKLPSAVGKDNLTFTIKNVGTAKDVTVEPEPSETIDGMSNLTLVPSSGVPSVIKTVAHGGKWWIVAKG